MLTEEEFVEASALRGRGWSVSAIARHLGRDRKTIRAYLAGERQPGTRRAAVADRFARFEPYLRERLREDPHVWGTVLFDEVVSLGFERSYVTFVRELRRRALRPRCEACAGVRGRPTVEIEHPPGEEVQWDWLELPEAPWGDGGASAGGDVAVFGPVPRRVLRNGGSGPSDQRHRRACCGAWVGRPEGGGSTGWRRCATPARADSRSDFAQVARSYGVTVEICGARRANRKGAVESSNHYLAQRFWRTLVAASPVEAQAKLDGFCAKTADQRRRNGSTVGELATGEGLRVVAAGALPGHDRGGADGFGGRVWSATRAIATRSHPACTDSG